ncbi:hypothetical protein F4803DRAFT_546853 [Xylaria telfairii]|nr:hypothetical protein F4803DRAFT_546853 [Xylaria telfairii]
MGLAKKWNPEPVLSKQRPRQDLGLKQVYPDPEIPIEDDKDVVDIVAIHGLDSQSPTAWVAWRNDGDPTSGDVHWLKDSEMLPSKIKKSRIFTYDWPAGVGLDASIAGIFDHSMAFLSSLQVMRKETKTTRRPLIFVAACFGGLLLAKALVEACSPCSEEKYGDIVRHTVGVTFLGTPFQGTDDFLLQITLLRISAAIDAGTESSHELAKLLRHNGNRRELDELVHKFCQVKDNPKYKFPVVCFYETLQTQFKGFLKRLPRDVVRILDSQGSATVQFHPTLRFVHSYSHA